MPGFDSDATVLEEHQRAAFAEERGVTLESTSVGFLLLDEPTRALDEEGVRWLCNWARLWQGA